MIDSTIMIIIDKTYHMSVVCLARNDFHFAVVTLYTWPIYKFGFDNVGVNVFSSS